MRAWIVGLLGAIGVLASGLPAFAAGPIVAEAVWSRATPPGATTGVIYLTLINSGTSDDQLTAASSGVADKVQFHSAMDDNGVMKMSPLTGIDVPAGGTVVLKPSNTHLMLLRVKHQLVAGQTFPLTLTFDKAGPIEVEVRVGTVGAMTPPEAAASSP